MPTIEEHDRLAKEINNNTIEQRIGGWIDNLKANQKYINGGYGVVSLVNSLANVPVIVIGSGPTLDFNIEDLRGLEDRAMLICAGSALAALQDAGVYPNLVLMSDSFANNLRSLNSVHIPKYNFILDSFVHPTIVEALQEAKRIYWYHTPPIVGCPFTFALRSWTGHIGEIASGGCGATAAWSVAVSVCGGSPDILVGLPEAYYDPQKHYSSRVMATHDVYIYKSAVEITADAFGVRCYTNKAYKSFAMWFHDAFSRIPGIHINCSEGGIVKAGCLLMSLKECKERVLKEKYDIEGLLFAKEHTVERYLQDIEPELSPEVKSFLVMLLDSPSIPNVSLRMGWTHPEVAQTVINLREMGLSISERPIMWTPPEEEVSQQTLVYTLEGPSG